MDIVSFIGCLIYLLAPWVTYEYFDKSDPLAKLWSTYMTIDKDQYFAYAIPGTIMLVLGLNYSSDNYQTVRDKRNLDNCRSYLTGKSYIGIVLISMGLTATFLGAFLPASLSSILYYFNQLTFVGILYLLFSRFLPRVVLLVGGFGLLIGQSVVTGMYSELIFWSVFGGIILLVGKSKHSFVGKAFLIFIGLFGILLLQSIKHEYRKDISTGSQQGSDPAYFYSLIKDRLSDPSSLITPARSFGMIARTNQGLFVGMTMDYVPRRENYAYGETIIKAMGASLVPRFVWPTKPEAGGRDNVCRFLGDCSRKKYSYNIGQLGEAYVNFGKFGGVLFMFIYGWFINLTYKKIIDLGAKFPTLILWVPMFYFMVLSLETDVLTFLNAFAKAIVFATFCFLSFRWFLKIKL